MDWPELNSLGLVKLGQEVKAKNVQVRFLLLPMVEDLVGLQLQEEELPVHLLEEVLYQMSHQELVDLLLLELLE
jgi:hypothetical protein